MMGRNELRLCKAEMIRAMEYYLNEVQFKETVVVTDVVVTKEITAAFVVSLSEAPVKGESDNNSLA